MWEGEGDFLTLVRLAMECVSSRDNPGYLYVSRCVSLTFITRNASKSYKFYQINLRRWKVKFSLFFINIGRKERLCPVKVVRIRKLRVICSVKQSCPKEFPSTNDVPKKGQYNN